MRRLTRKAKNGKTSVGSRYGLICENDDLANADIFAVIDRMGEYEDTGLTPEEIMDGKMLTDWIPVEKRLPEASGVMREDEKLKVFARCEMKKKRKKQCHAKGKVIAWSGRMNRCQKSDCEKCHCYY